MEGQPLSETIRESGPPKEKAVIEWAKQLCDVLCYLHTRKPPIIYRDMKPGNIMLRPDGKVMLIDFGTAREFKSWNPADTTCLGTVGYAAPEQFGGMGQTDARTDIYNLGATLYHLVTGKNPSEPPYEIRPIREENPALSSGLEKIIEKAVRLNPDERYQSAEEMLYALEHFEEYDAGFRKKERRKFSLFMAAFSCAFLGLILGVGLQTASRVLSRRNYDALLLRASTAVRYETKLDLYRACIEDFPKMAGRKDAYLGLMRACKEDDFVLSLQEAELISGLISTHASEIRRAGPDYTAVYFEFGKMIWYYYDYGENARMSRAVSAVPWFREAAENAADADENAAMARVYYEIGVFCRDIVADINEGSDRGKYGPFFDNLDTLVRALGGAPDEAEIVRLELLELARAAIQQYAVKFRRDGVTEEALRGLLQEVSKDLYALTATSDLTAEKRRKSIELLPSAEEMIRSAYADPEEGL